MNVYSKFGLRYVSEEKENYLSGSSAVEALEASLLKLLCKKVCLPRRAQGGKNLMQVFCLPIDLTKRSILGEDHGQYDW